MTKPPARLLRRPMQDGGPFPDPAEAPDSRPQPAFRCRDKVHDGRGFPVAAPDPAGLQLLHDAAEKANFSARAYHRILKVARTLADLDGSETTGRIHLAEAISYRATAEPMARAA